MIDLTNKLNNLNTTKNLIKDAIVDKGVEVGPDDTFRSYAEKINAIPKSQNQSTSTITFEQRPLFDEAHIEISPNWEQHSNYFSSKYQTYKVNARKIYLEGEIQPQVDKLDAMYSQAAKNCTLIDLSKLTGLDKDTIRSTSNMFSNNYNRSDPLNIVMPVIKSSSCNTQGMFSQCETNDIDLSNFYVKTTQSNSMFALCKWLKTIDISHLDLSAATNMSGMFEGNLYLTDIIWDLDHPIGLSATNTNDMFGSNPFNTSQKTKNLSHDTILNLFNGLADRTKTGPITLPLGPENLGRMSEAEKQIAVDKGWTLA